MKSRNIIMAGLAVGALAAASGHMYGADEYGESHRRYDPRIAAHKAKKPKIVKRGKGSSRAKAKSKRGGNHAR